MLWLDRFTAHVMQERLVTVTAAAAGMRGPDKKPVQVTDVGKELEQFHVRLRRPLNHERVQAAILREVAR